MNRKVDAPSKVSPEISNRGVNDLGEMSDEIWDQKVNTLVKGIIPCNISNRLGGDGVS